MPFGKHKGKSIFAIREIDKDYLIWLSNADHTTNNLKQRIMEIL